MNDTTLAGSALLTNEVGLHARPSVKLTQLAKKYPGRVEFALDPAGPWFDAKSPVQVMRAKAPRGTTLHFRCAGEGAAEALSAMIALVERRFDEEDGAAAPVHGRASP